MSEKTRERVLEAARKLSFQPNRLARALVTARSHTVGVIVHDISDPYFGEIVKGLEDGIHPEDYRLFIASSERDPEIGSDLNMRPPAPVLDSTERVEGRPFTDPKRSEGDRARLTAMVRQLVDTYDDPVVCDFAPGKRPVCQSDPLGRHFRIYYVQPAKLFDSSDLTVVGFFGERREGADIRPLLAADKRFESEFHRHRGLLSLSTVRLPDGDFANLVLFTDPEAKDAWNTAPIHRDTVAEISPPYYQSIRLSNGVLPGGLADPEALVVETVKYIDYSSDPPWRAVRHLTAT